MKLYRVWLMIIISTLIFLGILGNLSNKTALDINNDLVYINGYFNFAFNGMTRLFNGKKINDQDSLEIESEPRLVNINKSDTKPKIKYTTYDKKVEEGLNKSLKKTFGFDLNEMIYKVKTLPLK